MNATFPVEWRQIFKSLSVFMALAIIIPVTLLMGLRFVSSGFDYSKTFEHMPFPIFLLILICVPIFSIAFSLLFAQWFRLATITISEETISGRSFWGLNNRIPFADITKLTPFNNNGIKAIIVNSQHHGQIYISDKTQRLPELLAFLNDYLPEDQKLDNAEQKSAPNP